MDTCFFCNLGAGQVVTTIIYEDESTMAFLDINPLAPGHSVVIPKLHAENILDLSDQLVAPLFLAVKRVTDSLKSTLNPVGFTIGINQGRQAGQAIDHLHIHVIPRYRGDGGGSIHSIVKYEPEKLDLKILAEKIRSGY